MTADTDLGRDMDAWCMRQWHRRSAVAVAWLLAHPAILCPSWGEITKPSGLSDAQGEVSPNVVPNSNKLPSGMVAWVTALTVTVSAFRDALGAYATGVTVTTASADSGPRDHRKQLCLRVSRSAQCCTQIGQAVQILRGAKHFAIHVLTGINSSFTTVLRQVRRLKGSVDLNANGVPSTYPYAVRNAVWTQNMMQTSRYMLERVVVQHDGLPLLFQAGRFVSIKVKLKNGS
jgi:hypothetical protein